MGTYPGLSVSKEAGITTVFLENLRLTGLLTYMIGWLFADLEDDAETEAVILTGRKNVFLSGADLKDLGELRNREEAAAYIEIANAAWTPVREFPKPLVVAINGHCLGGGLELALSGDLRICVDRVQNLKGESVAFLGFPETSLGVVPPLGGVQLLTRLVGPAHAKHLLFTADPITAQRAHEIGLVDRLASPEGLMDGARAVARSILQSSANAVREVKVLVDQSPFFRSLDEALLAEKDAFARCCEVRDKNVRIAAFLSPSREAAGSPRQAR